MPVKTTRPARRIGENSRISQRGFASMDPERQRELASQGGRTTHARGRGHRWTSEEARIMGRKGGLVSKRGPARPKSQPTD